MIVTNAELIEAIQSGSENRQELYTQLWEQNEGLIKYAVKPYLTALEPCTANSSERMNEALQEAYVAFALAVPLYDPEKGAFSSYIIQAVRRQLIRASGQRRLIHIPEGVRAETHRYNVNLESLTEELRRPPTMEEMMERYKYSEKKIEQLKQASKLMNLYSMDVTLSDDGETTLGDTIADPGADHEEETVKREQFSGIWKLGESILTKRQLKVLILRYAKEMQYTDIAESLGISAERVRQIIEDAHRRLRESLEVQKMFDGTDEYYISRAYKQTGREYKTGDTATTAIKILEDKEKKTAKVMSGAMQNFYYSLTPEQRKIVIDTMGEDFL